MNEIESANTTQHILFKRWTFIQNPHCNLYDLSRCSTMKPWLPLPVSNTWQSSSCSASFLPYAIAITITSHALITMITNFGVIVLLCYSIHDTVFRKVLNQTKHLVTDDWNSMVWYPMTINRINWMRGRAIDIEHEMAYPAFLFFYHWEQFGGKSAKTNFVCVQNLLSISMIGVVKC